MPLDYHLPSVFPLVFGMSNFVASCLFQFKMFEFVHSFEIGICSLLFSLHFCPIVVLKVHLELNCYSVTGLPLSSIYLYAVYFSC